MGSSPHFGRAAARARWSHEERRLTAGGTVLCGVDETHSAHEAAVLAAALAARLGLRLVLAHVVAVDDGVGDAEVALTRLADDLARADDVEIRVEAGDRAELLARIAAEEGADVVVLGSRPRGLRAGRLGCPLARELETTTAVPILIAPPQTRRRSARRLAVATAPAA